MSKKLLALSFSVILLFSTSSKAFASYSPQEAIAENKVKFQQLNNKILDINVQVTNLNSDIDKLNTAINTNNTNIKENQAQINTLEKKLDKLKEDIKDSQALADKRLRAMYKNSYNKSYISLLLTSENFSDLFSKFQAAKRIASADKKILNQLDSQKKSLNENVHMLEVKLQDIVELKDLNVSNLEELNEKKADLVQLATKFNDEKKAAALLIEQNETKLISHSISVIESQKSSIADMRNALLTLRTLTPQLNTSSVKKKAQEYIKVGSEKLTLLIANSNSANNNSSDTYKATYTMIATAYSGHGITALGLKPVRDPDGLSTIAVDPTIIPLGSKVYIPGYGYAICSDTGGSIKGYKIDIYLNSNAECYNWGRRNVTLHVIAYPGEW